MYQIKPNDVTTLRLILIFPIVLFQQIGTAWCLAFCLFLNIVNELLDSVDGRLARRNKQVTDFGKLYDPFVDSLFRDCLFLAFFGSGWGMELWMICLIFARDITVAYARIYALLLGLVMEARWSGKYIKAVPQAAANCVVICVFMLKEFGFDLPTAQISYILMFAVTILTVISGLDYLNSIRAIVKGKKI